MRTIVNTVERLGDRYDFFIVTRDHDGARDRQTYKDVRVGDWNAVGQAQVYYLPQTEIRPANLRRLVLHVAPDAIYFNSFFATLTVYVLILRKMNLIPAVSVLLAPCGELADGALGIKTFKKKLFIAATKTFGIYDDAVWKASSELEKKEISRVASRRSDTFVVPDLSPKTILPEFNRLQKPPKPPGAVKMIFLARFVRIKNFKWLLEHLPQAAGRIEIDVWGPIEDAEYWRECEKIIKDLPENIRVAAKGSIPNSEAARKMFDYHFFILPTIGENFGHIVLEALAAGCPLIISDLTPWRELEEKKIGWDLPLDAPEKWIETINYCVNLGNAEYSELSANARDFAVRWLADDSVERKTAEILNRVLQNSPLAIKSK